MAEEIDLGTDDTVTAIKRFLRERSWIIGSVLIAGILTFVVATGIFILYHDRFVTLFRDHEISVVYAKNGDLKITRHIDDEMFSHRVEVVFRDFYEVDSVKSVERLPADAIQIHFTNGVQIVCHNGKAEVSLPRRP
ncbi:MAG: hypothetical protein AB7O26_02685 [Planctomycetaceae bacterium]